MANNNTISITYSDEKLRILVEEYITQQRTSFTLKGVCSYVLFWAIEEGRATQSGDGLFEGDEICQADCERIRGVLEKIVGEGRIIANSGSYEKSMN